MKFAVSIAPAAAANYAAVRIILYCAADLFGVQYNYAAQQRIVCIADGSEVCCAE